MTLGYQYSKISSYITNLVQKNQLRSQALEFPPQLGMSNMMAVNCRLAAGLDVVIFIFFVFLLCGTMEASCPPCKHTFILFF